MTTRDPSADPHYLHGARALEALVSPPVDHPRALCWLDADTLLVAARDGAVHRVEPSFGTRTLFSAVPDAACIATARGRLAVLGREGLLQVWSLDGALAWERPTGLLAGLQLQWWSGGVAVSGDDLTDRRVLVFDDDGERKARARVPGRTALGADGEGALLLAQSTEGGLAVAPFGRPLPGGASTVHQLRFSGSAVLGVATGGVTVWRPPEEAPVNVKLYDVVNAALSADGALLAMGTRSGAVALASPNVGGQRVNPSRVAGHDGPVLALAFPPRGRWLASAAARCWVWSY